MATNGRKPRVAVRFHCPNNPGHRTYPYDSMESITIAPEPGMSGGDILLGSYNGRRRHHGDDVTAWCWACGMWVDAVRRTRAEFILDYLKRDSVKLRVKSETERAMARELTVAAAKRSGGAKKR